MRDIEPYSWRSKEEQVVSLFTSDKHHWKGLFALAVLRLPGILAVAYLLLRHPPF